MPVYEFKCRECNNQYEAYVPRIDGMIDCPSCQSKNVERLMSAPAILDSVGDSGPSCSSGTCGLPTGGCSNGMCGLS